MPDHRKLRAFELADEIALLIYQVTNDFPREEIYGLTSQMRRAAVSVPSNIVEGCARESQAEYRNFLNFAFASLRELHYQFSLVERLGFIQQIDVNNYRTKLKEAEMVLGALLRSMRAGNSHRPSEPSNRTIPTA